MRQTWEPFYVYFDFLLRIILISNKTIDKKSSHNLAYMDYAMIFCIAFNWCLV